MSNKVDKLQLLNNGQEIWQEESDYVLEKTDKGLMLHRVQADLRKIYIEVTSRCNLDCITCIRNNWDVEPGNMSLELFRKIIDDLEDMPKVKEIVLGGLGEPLIHPDIVEMIKTAKEKGFQVKITTNGILLEDALMDKLIELNTDELVVSIDSFKEDEFKKIRRGGSISDLLENLKFLKSKKEQKQTIFPRVSMEFVLMQSNEDQLQKLTEHARDLGIISILVTNLLPYTEDMKNEILFGRGEKELEMPIQFWSTPIKGLSTMCTINYPSMNWGADRKCDFVNRDACTVTYNGDVSSCYALMHSYNYYIFDRKKEVSSHYFGNLREKSLYEVWNSPEYLKFRHRVRNFSFPSCEDCKINDKCTYTRQNQDCWGNRPSCSDCLWAQGIVRCP